jgi:cyclopropane fatty-acyl-phospholipid synthase-like methyltransferase
MAAPAFTIIDHKAKEQKANEEQANEKNMLDNDKAHGYTALESKQFYDTYASGYEQEGPSHEAEIQIFLKEAQLQKGESILDLGCGNGILTLKVKKLVGHGNVAGVDISERMLEYARKRSVKGMHFLCGDIVLE